MLHPTQMNLCLEVTLDQPEISDLGRFWKWLFPYTVLSPSSFGSLNTACLQKLCEFDFYPVIPLVLNALYGSRRNISRG